jgi:hypothetical protein
LVCGVNVRTLDGRGAFWSENSAYIAAETGAMEVARDTVAPDFVPEDAITAAAIGVHNLQPVSAGPYLSAVRAFGSAADRPQDILKRPEPVRQDRFVRFGNVPRPLARVRLQDGITMGVDLPRDRSSIPWRVRVAGGREVRLRAVAASRDTA